MNLSSIKIIVFLGALSLLASCGGGNASFTPSDGDTISLRYVTNLTLVKHNGFTVATVRNPWDTTKILHTYLLVPKSAEISDSMPKGTIVRTPLSNALIYSSVHNSLVADLGALEAIKGVCDSKYISNKEIAGRIAAGTVTDCGNSQSPDIEKIIRLSPDAILLSPYENSNGYGKLSQLNIPIVECADYMENSPLARAEWMKFYGILFGKEAEADSMFNATEQQYIALKKSVESISKRPSVMTDAIYSGTWYVPGAYSTTACFIRDAGGKNPFDTYKQAGSAAISPEQALYTAHNADIWLVRYSSPTDLTLEEFNKENAIYSQFDAFKQKNVYGCNTAKSLIYEDMSFHPQLLLAEMIGIFHPELSNVQPKNRYFVKLPEK
jgi:iron complex transport system substrate-binding protein